MHFWWIVTLSIVIYRASNIQAFLRSSVFSRTCIIRTHSFKMAQNIDGTAISAQIRAELKNSVVELHEKYGVTPGLAVLLVGARRDSATYVRMKKKACDEIGIANLGQDYPAEVTEAELLAKIDELNAGEL